MTALLQHVRRTIRRHGLCPPGTRLVVALSGGSDSVALTRILLELSVHGGFEVAALAHLNHGLRETSGRDEAFCRTLASRLGLPFLAESADVRGIAQDRSLSLEDAARRVRYAFLERAADEVGADLIAVGHTQDDQAETFLLKLIRGAGLTGLAGVYPRRGRVVRPLLDVTRSELRDYLVREGQHWVEDETNDDLENPRNRIRHVVLPELDRTAGGSTRGAIARAASLIREDAQWLDELSEREWSRLVSDAGAGVEIEVSALAATPLPVARRVLLRVMRNAAGDREVGLEHVEAVMALLGAASGGVDLPGARMELRAGKLVLLEQKPVPK